MSKGKRHINWRKLGRVAAWVVLIGATLVGTVAARFQQKAVTCTSIAIEVDYDDNVFFLDEQDIEQVISNFCGDSLPATRIHELDFNRLERRIEHDPYVLNAEIYSPRMGELKVAVTQRQPILRVINKAGVSYYIDEYGEKVPLSPKFTRRVPVASGHIPAVDQANVNSDTTVLHDIFKLIQHIRQDEFLHALTEQVYVNEQGELELVPRLGDLVFVLGDISELEQKFAKLQVFYREVGKSTNVNQYKTVNLKFKDQIVCTKKRS